MSKRFINYILIILFISCSFTLLKYSNLNLFSGVKYLDSLFSSSDIDKIRFKLIYDLSIGYAITFMFYVVLQLIPFHNQYKLTKSVLFLDTYRIYESLNTFLNLTFKTYEIEKSIHDCKIEDLYKIKPGFSGKIQMIETNSGTFPFPAEAENYHIKYGHRYIVNGRHISGMVSLGFIYDLLYSRMKIILENIERILEYRYTEYMGAEFYNIMRDLKECSMFKYRNDDDKKFFQVTNSDKNLMELLNFYNRLSSFYEFKHYDSVIEVSIKSKEEYKLEQQKNSERRKKIRNIKKYFISTNISEENIFMKVRRSRENDKLDISQIYDSEFDNHVLIFIVDKKVKKNLNIINDFISKSGYDSDLINIVYLNYSKEYNLRSPEGLSNVRLFEVKMKKPKMYNYNTEKVQLKRKTKVLFRSIDFYKDNEKLNNDLWGKYL
ncbi:MAG: hypothetical protein KQ78_01194 [Candidatus Izimaplasma bacterium HR2]|nr:MAG: hypothetical protein KQ78_01194 [Candidatus Izimaplasma bacterium HR2]